MNIDGIYHFIETEFKVIKNEKDLICVAPASGGDYPETTVKLTLNEGRDLYELFEVVKGKEYKVDVFTDKYKSIIALYFFSKSKLEVRKLNTDNQNKVVNAASLNDLQKMLTTFLDDNYYSLLKMVPDKIILEKSTNDTYNVLFLGKRDSKTYITKSRNLNRAAIVLCHFSSKLRQFYGLIEKTEVKDDIEFIETLKELYLLG
ncbi:hypothetical protein [Rossellomorea vietnamensis]|uniref:hypothetical protein n=1 Tax=Rossellomorea vietnamensis TaxID=218284 RepID=UPI001E580E09|nr:hypothetical protein [Rossellomorea vietnamensis]MCC5804367.1 hypothetical protein [Rossellomorea vietnamensis]